MQLILLSGPIAVGKSAVTKILVRDHGFQQIRSSTYLKKVAKARGIDDERSSLQDLGDELDEKTDYSWVVTEVVLPLVDKDGLLGRKWIFDSVRKERQIEHFRSKFGASILHVHLLAAEDLLRFRFVERAKYEGLDWAKYESLINHSNEVSARSLHAVADLVIDNSDINAFDCAQKIINA